MTCSFTLCSLRSSEVQCMRRVLHSPTASVPVNKRAGPDSFSKRWGYCSVSMSRLSVFFSLHTLILQDFLHSASIFLWKVKPFLQVLARGNEVVSLPAVRLPGLTFIYCPSCGFVGDCIAKSAEKLIIVHIIVCLFFPPCVVSWCFEVIWLKTGAYCNNLSALSGLSSQNRGPWQVKSFNLTGKTYLSDTIWFYSTGPVDQHEEV